MISDHEQRKLLGKILKQLGNFKIQTDAAFNGFLVINQDNKEERFLVYFRSQKIANVKALRDMIYFEPMVNLEMQKSFYTIESSEEVAQKVKEGFIPRLREKIQEFRRSTLPENKKHITRKEAFNIFYNFLTEGSISAAESIRLLLEQGGVGFDSLNNEDIANKLCAWNLVSNQITVID